MSEPRPPRGSLEGAANAPETVTKQLPGSSGPVTATYQTPKSNSSESPGFKTGEVLAGRYRIQEELGRGGMGEVYRAEELKLSRSVAIKIVRPDLAADPTMIARFDREARALASLNHPHIATVYGLDEHAGTRFLVMEFIDGPSLADWISGGPVPWRKASTVMSQIADALSAAHARSIAHRDLKPANVMIAADARAKVLDFGLATPTAGSNTDPGLSRVGGLLGTPAYMAPEQVRGELADARADIWALGCVLFELVGGSRPFQGGTASDTLASVLTAEPNWDLLASRAPPEVLNLVQKCIRKPRAERIQTMAEVRSSLERALAASDVNFRPAPAPTRHEVPSRRLAPSRRTALALIGGGGLVAAGVATAVWLAHPQAGEPDPSVSDGPDKQTRNSDGPDKQTPDPGSPPVSTGDAPVYEAILADLGQADAADVPWFRYLSLQHLASSESATDFAKARADFLSTVETAFRRGSPPPRAINAAETVFRIDLREVGWDHSPFKVLGNAGKNEGDATANLFDVVLLEYPYLSLGRRFVRWSELVKKFLEPARQVRPVVFVRGDWFAYAVSASTLATDLRQLITLFEQILPLPKPRQTPGPKPPEQAEFPPVDAWYGDDPPGPPTIEGLRVDTLDIDSVRLRDRFFPGERFRLRISADESMHVEYIWIDSKGRIDTQSGVTSYRPGKPLEFPLPREGELADELGKERLIVFCGPNKFPPAQAWRAKHPTKTIERFVHPFFSLEKGPDGPFVSTLDSTVTRRTVFITIADPKNK